MKNNVQMFFAKMSPKSLIWLVFALISTVSMTSFGQSRSLKGTVTSVEEKSGVPGVTIRVKGSSKGTLTDAQGAYSISVSGNEVLQFSMIGYTSKEVAVGNVSELNVVLSQDEKQLQEVVVTALGIKKDIRKIGVAIQSVDGASTIKAREPNAINALSGRVAGLTIGSQPELLRKPNISLRGSSTVLYVVDGVPINSDTWNISPDDIETYSVLKGASASALYGFRGKNGAILITTKRGSSDKRGFSVEVNSSTQ